MPNIYVCIRCNRLIQLWIDDINDPYNEFEVISKNCKPRKLGEKWVSEKIGICNA